MAPGPASKQAMLPLGGGSRSGRLPRAVTGRLLWTKATAGGRSCQAACRGLSGTPNGPYVAVNVGTGSSPSFVCRAYVRPNLAPCVAYLPLPSQFESFHPRLNSRACGERVFKGTSGHCAGCRKTPLTTALRNLL